jgi:hypothetical protein
MCEMTRLELGEDEEPRNSTTSEVVQGEAVKRKICDGARRACAPSWQ